MIFNFLFLFYFQDIIFPETWRLKLERRCPNWNRLSRVLLTPPSFCVVCSDFSGRDVRVGQRPRRLRPALERHREGGEEILHSHQENFPRTRARICHACRSDSQPPTLSSLGFRCYFEIRLIALPKCSVEVCSWSQSFKCKESNQRDLEPQTGVGAKMHQVHVSNMAPRVRLKLRK